MSYDFSVQLATGGKPAYVGDMNVTYNLSPMFSKALGVWIRDLHGRKMGDIRDMLREACADMAANPEVYEAMNPVNGWGDSEAAARTLQTLLSWSIDYPDGTLHIS